MMAARRRRPPPDAPPPPWMITFADLVSLLLTFMVMLFATSAVAPDQWRQATASLEQTIDWPGRQQPQAKARLGIGAGEPAAALDLDYLAEVLRTALFGMAVGGDARIVRQDDRLVLILPRLAFVPGEAGLADPSAAAILAGLIPTLRGISNAVALAGYGDAPAIRRTGEPAGSDWELPLARALAVARILAAAGFDRPVGCYALAESPADELGDTFKDASPAAASRVDLVFYASAKNGR